VTAAVVLSSPSSHDDGSDLDPADAALDAAAFAAAALLASLPKETPPQSDSAEGETPSLEPSLGDASAEAQILLRVFQSTCRPGLDAAVTPNPAVDSKLSARISAVILEPLTPANVDAGTVILAESSLDAVDASGMGNKSVRPAAGLPSVQTEEGVLVVPLGGVRDGVEGQSLAVKFPGDQFSYISNPELEANMVVNAVNVYSRISSSLEQIVPKPPVIEDGQPQLILDSLDPVAQVVVAPSPFEGEDGTQSNLGQESSSQSHFAGENPRAHVGQQVYSQKGTMAVLGGGEQKLISAQTDDLLAENGGVVKTPQLAGGEVDSAGSRAVIAPPETSVSDQPFSDLGFAGMGSTHEVSNEVVGKPVIEGPHQIHSNVEFWKVISDAVQRVRSENPRHLAVELRLGDGSSVGLELRMGATGLEASFKSESHGLLKALESQWSSFVERTSSEPVKVASSSFEGRTGADINSGGGDARERREALEDSSSAGALSSFKEQVSVKLPSESELEATPLLGRLNIYA
jgi:hypothetical protein